MGDGTGEGESAVNTVNLLTWANDNDGKSRVAGYTYDEARIGSWNGTVITGLKGQKVAGSGEAKDSYTLSYTTVIDVANASGSDWTQYKDSVSGTNDNNANVYLVFHSTSETFDVNYVDEDGNELRKSDSKLASNIIWKPLYERFGIHIDFGYRTFVWDSEANDKAHVHVVIVGFSSAPSSKPKYIFEEGSRREARNINPYLMDAENVFIEGRSKPLCDVPILQNGGKPTEGGNLILTAEERDELLEAEPQAEKFIRPYMMGKDFIDRRPRYCLWLVGANPAVLKKCPHVMERVERVRQYRLASPKAATRKKAETPTLFDEVRECTSDYVAIPKVSSQRRRYVPMEYLSHEIIPGDKLFMIQGSTLYHFGVLTSNVHMAWMRTVAGRLKSDYSYSNTIVYNNFPWPDPTPEQKDRITHTAQAILDARALYPDSSLADLYDPLTMPPELRKAHTANDIAVMKAYGFSTKMSELNCVGELMRMYEELTKK